MKIKLKLSKEFPFIPVKLWYTRKQCSHGWDLKSIGGSPRRFRNCTFEALVFLFQCNFMRRKT